MPEKGDALPSSPHTRAKHRILREYLTMWFPILGASHNKVVYIDGFAGPGVYEGGEPGSPVVALETALEHTGRVRFNDIVFWFIEKDAGHAAMLERELGRRFPGVGTKECDRVRYFVRHGEFAGTVEGVLDKVEAAGHKLAPTFAFLDPFGFNGIPMEVIGRILGYARCEVMVTFMDGFINRFHGTLQERALNGLYGTDAWKEIGGDDAAAKYVDLYKSQLVKAGARYVRTFRMDGSGNRHLYHLVYATKHIRGLKAIKTAMQKASQTGEYSFSDTTDPRQQLIIDPKAAGVWGPKAAAKIFEKFRGARNVPVGEIEEYVLADTEYLFAKSILKGMEEGDPPRITGVIDRKRKGTYPGGCRISFAT